MLLKTSWLSWINKMYSTANQRDESDGIIDEMVKFSRVKITIIIFFSNIESDSFEVFALENTFFSNFYSCTTWRILLSNLENNSRNSSLKFVSLYIIQFSRILLLSLKREYIWEQPLSLSLSNTCPWNSRFYISLTLQCICQYRWEKTETKKRILRFDCSSLNFITSNGNLASKKRRLTFPPFCLIDNLSFSPVTNHRSFRLSRVCFPFLSIFLPSPLSHTRASRDQN